MASVLDMCRRAAEVAPKVARLSGAVKDAALEEMARALESRSDYLVEANAEDVEHARADGASITSSIASR